MTDPRMIPWLEEWSRTWNLPVLPRSVRVEISPRLRRSLGRCRPDLGLIRLNPALDGTDEALLKEVLCHEVAHVAVHLLHGRSVRPHGPEWGRLMRAAGYEPRVRMDPAALPASFRKATRPRVLYQHRKAERTLRNWGWLLIASLILTVLAATAAQPGLQEVCAEFQAWYESHAVSGLPADEYRAELIARGVAPEEAERRLAMLRESANACPAAAGAAFDRIYSNPTPRFNTAPNELLAETVEGMKPGRALDVAMGQGRNAVFLARNGWDVTGFDVSAEGLSIARAAAETARVKMHIVQQGWQEFDLGTEQWDLIVLSYAWVPIDDPVYVQRLSDALRPGGYLVFEHLLKESRAALGMPSSQHLLRAFDDLRILRYEEVEQASDWNNERSPVVRLVARK